MSAPRAKNRRVLFGFTFALLLLVFCFWQVERNITQVVLSLSQARANALAVQALNQAAQETVHAGLIAYDDLMRVTTGPDGSVQLIQADTAEMNRLAAQVSILAQEKLQALESQTIAVPLGSALGMTLFAGAGPRFQVQMMPVGAVTTRFDTEFQTAGINQTRHKVLLTLTASVRLVIPTGAKAVEAAVQVAVAESIIVGHVPNSFVDVNNDDAMLDLLP